MRYAARGGNQSQGYNYSGSNDPNVVAWYDDNSEGKSHEVATKAKNELGIYDMSGNVFEWCQDRYGEISSEAQTNPTGPVRTAVSASPFEFLGSFQKTERIFDLQGRRVLTPGKELYIRNGKKVVISE